MANIESHFFAFLRRLRFIRRWGLMRSSEVENNQEHSLDVSFIVHNLVLMHNVYFGGHLDANKAAVIAMYHDVSEIFTGDMPTPIKYFDPKLRELYGEVESLAQQKLLSTLPKELQESYVPYLIDAEISPEWRFVKAADNLAAFLKCVNEKNSGNEEFTEAYQTILTKLQNLQMPEVDKFLEIYVPSLGYSLDKLNYSTIK